MSGPTQACVRDKHRPVEALGRYLHTAERSEIGNFGGGSLERLRPWLGCGSGVPVAGAHPGSAGLHGAARRALRRHDCRRRAGAPCCQGVGVLSLAVLSHFGAMVEGSGDDLGSIRVEVERDDLSGVA